jgi:hypothetical protein
MVKDVTRTNKWDPKYEDPFGISHFTKANSYQVQDKTGSIFTTIYISSQSHWIGTSTKRTCGEILFG